MLSKKYYIDIAYILKKSKTKKDIINQLGLYFRIDNERFDINKFELAIKGVKWKRIKH